MVGAASSGVGTGDSTPCQFPILNTATLLLDPLALLVGVTDYSGPDGIGGYWGRLDDVDPEVFTRAWLEREGPISSSLVGVNCLRCGTF